MRTRLAEAMVRIYVMLEMPYVVTECSFCTSILTSAAVGLTQSQTYKPEYSRQLYVRVC